MIELNHKFRVPIHGEPNKTQQVSSAAAAVEAALGAGSGIVFPPVDQEPQTLPADEPPPILKHGQAPLADGPPKDGGHP